MPQNPSARIWYTWSYNERLAGYLLLANAAALDGHDYYYVFIQDQRSGLFNVYLTESSFYIYTQY